MPFLRLPLFTGRFSFLFFFFFFFFFFLDCHSVRFYSPAIYPVCIPFPTVPLPSHSTVWSGSLLRWVRYVLPAVNFRFHCDYYHWFLFLHWCHTFSACRYYCHTHHHLTSTFTLHYVVRLRLFRFVRCLQVHISFFVLFLWWYTFCYSSGNFLTCHVGYISVLGTTVLLIFTLFVLHVQTLGLWWNSWNSAVTPFLPCAICSCLPGYRWFHPAHYTYIHYDSPFLPLSTLYRYCSRYVDTTIVHIDSYVHLQFCSLFTDFWSIRCPTFVRCSLIHSYVYSYLFFIWSTLFYVPILPFRFTHLRYSLRFTTTLLFWPVDLLILLRYTFAFKIRFPSVCWNLLHSFPHCLLFLRITVTPRFRFVLLHYYRRWWCRGYHVLYTPLRYDERLPIPHRYNDYVYLLLFYYYHRLDIPHSPHTDFGVRWFHWFGRFSLPLRFLPFVVTNFRFTTRFSVDLLFTTVHLHYYLHYSLLMVTPHVVLDTVSLPFDFVHDPLHSYISGRFVPLPPVTILPSIYRWECYLFYYGISRIILPVTVLRSDYLNAFTDSVLRVLFTFTITISCDSFYDFIHRSPGTFYICYSCDFVPVLFTDFTFVPILFAILSIHWFLYVSYLFFIPLPFPTGVVTRYVFATTITCRFHCSIRWWRYDYLPPAIPSRPCWSLYAAFCIVIPITWVALPVPFVTFLFWTIHLF